MSTNETRPLHWTDEEDQKLIELHEHYSQQESSKGLWTLVSNNLPERNPKQCRERYINHLQPGLDKSPLSVKEWELLDELHGIYGNQWSHIAMHFPSRMANHIKNQWNTRLRRLHSGPYKPRTRRTKRRSYETVSCSFSSEEEDQTSNSETDFVPTTRKRARDELVDQWEQCKKMKRDDPLSLLYMIAQNSY